jgi:hypothetical protein
MAMDKQVAIRLDAGIHDALQRTAADLGLTLSEYVRIMACWPFPYGLVAADVFKIIDRVEGHPDEAMPLLNSALARLETGELEMAALIEKIGAGLPQSQEASRAQLAQLKIDLHERVTQFGAWHESFAILRKRLEERLEKRRETP